MFKQFARTFATYGSTKLGKMLRNKFLNPTNKQRRKFYIENQTPTLPSTRKIASVKHEHAKLGKSRITVLTKLFMSHITDQMTTGKIMTMIEGKGFEITKLKLTDDLSVLNIYWITNKITNIVETEKILQRIGSILHHELSKLRLMSRVPNINFVKDKNLMWLMELDQQLTAADYGENFAPKFIENFKTDYYINLPPEPKIMEEIWNTEAPEEIPELPLPPMRHDVFGLDHDRILKKIKSAKETARNAWNRREGDIIVYEKNSNTDTSIEENIIMNDIFEEKRKKFNEFLKKRQIEQKKQLQMLAAKKEEIKYEYYNECQDESEDRDFEEHLDHYNYDER